MMLKLLEIKNFRSAGDPGIKIKFRNSTNLYALIGANNSGKSNTLDALSLVLGIRSGKFYNYDIQPTDFHNQDLTRKISIRLTLSEPLKIRNVYQQECYIEGFNYEAKSYVTGEEKGRIHVEHYCFGRNAKGISEDPLKDSDHIFKRKQGDSDEDIDNQKKPILARSHLYKLGPMYYLDIEHLDSFFRTSGLGPLGRLFQIYRDDFNSDSSKYHFKVGEEDKEMLSREAYKKAAERLVDVLKTDKLNKIETALAKNINSFLGFDENHATKINLGLPSHEEIFDRITQLQVKESDHHEPIAVSNLGSGYLSLFRLAALNTLAEMTEKVIGIYIIEEPEIYLHPHLRRFCHRILKKLASQNNVVIFASHSEEFVCLSDYLSIIRIEKSIKETESFQIESSVKIDFDKIRQKVKGKGNEEILFCQHALLTEGQDDQVVLSELLAKKGIDCDAKSISVIDCGSKSQIPDYIKLCKALNINYFVLFDTDKSNPCSASDTKKILDALGNSKTLYHAFTDTLEVALKTSKQSQDNWRHLLSIIEPLNYENITAQFPELNTATSAFVGRI